MDDKDIARRLKGFDAVWKRVGAAKASAANAAAAAKLPLMPGKNRRSGSRHNPGAARR